MRFLSVCSGIEAASCAWTPLGWTAAAFSEIEPFPCAVLAHHYPEVPNLGDMTKYQDWPDDLSIDLLCGGTPCQSYSLAGLRKGLADPRGNLMLTYLAIAAKYRPKWVVWENVPGVLSSWSGDEPPGDLAEGEEWEAVETSDFGSLLAGLGELGFGYAYRILDAQYFGVPQRRRRVFVIGCAGDWRAAAAVLFERHSLQGHPAPRRQAGQRPAGTLTRSALDGSSPCGGDGRDGLLIPEVGRALTTSNQRIDAETETFIVSQTLTGGARKHGGYSHDDVPMVAHSLRAEGFDASEDGTGRGTPIVPVQPYTLAIRGRGDCHDLEYRQDGTANALLTPNGGRGGIGVGAIAFDCKASGQNGFGVGEIASTLRAMSHAGNHANAGGHQAVAYTPEIASTMVARSSRGNGQTNSPGHQADNELIVRAMQVRRLTPRECERLQGFPDDYTAITVRGKPAADGPRYKALGNSWAVPCARWLGRRIEAVEAITDKGCQS